MALVRQTIQASTAAVWDALIDPTTYPRWLIGAQDIRDVDDSWPAVDAAFHHRVGVWPVLIDDRSIIREVCSSRFPGPTGTARAPKCSQACWKPMPAVQRP